MVSVGPVDPWLYGFVGRFAIARGCHSRGAQLADSVGVGQDACHLGEVPDARAREAGYEPAAHLCLHEYGICPRGTRLRHDDLMM